MILSAEEIKARVDCKDIFISDFDESRLNPNSYNLRLGRRFLTYVNQRLDCQVEEPYLIEEADGWVLQPGKLVLGQTEEYTESHGVVPMIEGRSSVARLGIFVHVTGGFGDIGFKGNWTLELACVQPVKIYAGMEICQIFYHTTTDVPKQENVYQGRYQGNTQVQPSKLWQDWRS